MSTVPMPNVLILTPVKDGARFLDNYASNLEGLAYPREKLSLGILEGDSSDASWDLIREMRPRLERRCRSVAILKRDYGFRLPPGTPRWTAAFQPARRNILARSRNQLLFRTLDEEDWVLWLDVDVVRYPINLVELLLEAKLDIVHPHCVKEPGGETFDLNAWSDRGAKTMAHFRGEARPVRLDAVGGTVLLVRADLHRDGLIFPPFPYGVQSQRIRPAHPVRGLGEIETEGFGIMAQDMGHQCWGLPNLEVVHAGE